MTCVRSPTREVETSPVVGPPDSPGSWKGSSISFPVGYKIPWTLCRTLKLRTKYKHQCVNFKVGYQIDNKYIYISLDYTSQTTTWTIVKTTRRQKMTNIKVDGLLLKGN